MSETVAESTWLPLLEWVYPAEHASAHPPCPVWTSESTFALFWFANDLLCAQDFDVANATIEPVGPVRTSVVDEVADFVVSGELTPSGHLLLRTGRQVGG